MITSIVMMVISVTVISLFYGFYDRPYKTIGYYESEMTVKKVDNTDKVGEKKKYLYELSGMNSSFVNILVVSNHNKDIKKGDKVIVKTPYLKFKGGEEKTVSDYQLLNPYNDVSTGGGKKYVKVERKMKH